MRRRRRCRAVWWIAVIAMSITIGATAKSGTVIANANPPVTCTAARPATPPSITVSKPTDLDPSGEIVAVSGSGFYECDGIYVAFCVMPVPGQTPTPCGGGVDLTGTTGASQWISSYPPAYGVGLATPYGPGGTFDVTLAVSPTIGTGVDCRLVQCAVVTRNDHTRSDDRSQDVLVPVFFAEASTSTTLEPTAPVSTTHPVDATPAASTTAPTATPSSRPSDVPQRTNPTDDGGHGAAWMFGGVLGVAAVGGAGVNALLRIRRRP